MPDFEFTGPTGTKYKVSGPEGTTPEQAFDVLKGHVVDNVNLDRPVHEVRADIAKLDEPFRAPALKRWADTYVAKERKDGGVLQGVNDAVRTVARGQFIGPYLDELTGLSQDALHKITGGYAGSPYDEALAYQRASDEAFDKENPNLSTAGKIAGGLAGGIAGWNAAAKNGIGLLSGAVAGPAAGAKLPESMVGKIAQGMGIGGLYGEIAGFGNAEGGEGSLTDQAMRRGEQALPAVAIGAGVGGAVPPVAAGAGKLIEKVGEAASPLFARVQAILGKSRPADTKLGMAASPQDMAPSGAGGGQPPGGVPPVSPGADAAAEQMIANQLTRANVPVSRLREQLGQADEAARFNSNSRAQNTLAPVDLDPSLQRLAGSTYRQQPEAANTLQSFMQTRQTGNTPATPLPETAGLPSRPVMAQPGKDDLPMGQFERVKDALKRALRIEDSKAHGHEANAYRTEQAIIENARKEADNLYGIAKEAGQNVNIRDVIEPVMSKWAQRAAEEPAGVAGHIRRALRQFMTENGPVTNLERFDKAKQFLDGVIEKFFESNEGRNRYVGGVLNELKKDLLSVIDDVQISDMGAKYKAAREAFGSRMEMRDALRLGREVFKENSDIAADQYQQLTSGQQKLFRLGLLDSFEQHMGRQKRTADITQVFDNPRIQGILQVVVPRSQKATAEFANRPERLGQYLANEKAMIGTRNEVLGNSKTQQRAADDEAFNSLQSIGDTFQQIKNSPTLTAALLKGVQGALDKAFGMRADTAAAIARKLATANRAEQEALFTALEQRMGPTRMATFAQMMREHEQALARAAAVATPSGSVSE